MSDRLYNPSLQVRISKLERNTHELKKRYRLLTRRFLGIFCSEFLLAAVTTVCAFPNLTLEVRGISDNWFYIALIVIQILLFLIWQILFMIKRDSFLKQYYIANALCAELTDYADWTNFYMRDPGSTTRRRLTSAVRNFNLLRLKRFFPELRLINNYTFLSLILDLFYILTSIALFRIMS